MDLSMLKNDIRLKKILAQIDSHCKDKVFSDIIDDAGNQYVDLVMEGGGMLGVGLVGYIHVLEHAHLRFLGLGGTSAGSITALLLATLDEPGHAKSEKLLHELTTQDFFAFVDGDGDARDLIKSWVGGAGHFKLAIKAAQVIDNLQNDLGLNPGHAFTAWLTRLLKENGIEHLDQLNKRLHTTPQGLRLRPERAPESLGNTPDDLFSLAIIAADITTETKAEFPRMAGLYWHDVGSLNPALFVRASMSIPFFFQPMIVNDIPARADTRARWVELAHYPADTEPLPTSVMFVDGGIMSNFPIDVFHNTKRIPRAPTFGVKLELDNQRADIKGPLVVRPDLQRRPPHPGL